MIIIGVEHSFAAALDLHGKKVSLIPTRRLDLVEIFIIISLRRISDMNSGRNRKQRDTNRKFPDETNRNRKWECFTVANNSFDMCVCVCVCVAKSTHNG